MLGMSGLRRLLPRSLGRPTFRGSELREAFASFGIIIVLTVAVIWSIPGAPIKDAMAPPLQPIARFTGLDQTSGHVLAESAAGGAGSGNCRAL